MRWSSQVVGGPPQGPLRQPVPRLGSAWQAQALSDPFGLNAEEQHVNPTKLHVSPSHLVSEF